jgi:hypothetical protein
MLLGLAAILIAGSFGCKSDPGTGPGGTGLPVDLMNFTGAPANMGVPGSLVAVNPTSMTNPPVQINVANPGVGQSIAFEAQQGGQTVTVSCTVTDLTNVSVPPQVAYQTVGGISCVDW